MEMTEYEYAGGYDEGGYDDGSGYDTGAYEVPEDHWTNDQAWVQWADAMVNALKEDPSLIDSFETYLRERPEAAPAKSPGLMSKELRKTAEEFLRSGREQR
jgi:hypothetical protein